MGSIYLLLHKYSFLIGTLSKQTIPPLTMRKSGRYTVGQNPATDPSFCCPFFPRILQNQFSSKAVRRNLKRNPGFEILQSSVYI